MMQFILTGFTQDAGFRVFAFESLAADRTRTKFTVRTDLALIRNYGIRVQELPLLCRGFLEQVVEGDQLLEGGLSHEGNKERSWIFTEEQMQRHAAICSIAKDTAQRKKAVRKPAPAPVGTGWRAPRPW